MRRGLVSSDSYPGGCHGTLEQSLLCTSSCAPTNKGNPPVFHHTCKRMLVMHNHFMTKDSNMIIPELDAVTPSNQLTPDVNIGSRLGKVSQRIIIHHPSIMSSDESGLWGEHESFFLFHRAYARLIKIP